MKNKTTIERRLLDAVSTIMVHHGFQGLTIGRVSKLTGVSRILIVYYFGSFTKLIIACIVEKNFWTHYIPEYEAGIDRRFTVLEQLRNLLEKRFHYFHHHCEMEVVIIKEFSSDNRRFRKLYKHPVLVNYRKPFPDWAENVHDKGSYYNIVSTLLVAGTQQMILKQQALPFHNVENTVALQEELLKTISQIVDWSFNSFA